MRHYVTQLPDGSTIRVSGPYPASERQPYQDLLVYNCEVRDRNGRWVTNSRLHSYAENARDVAFGYCGYYLLFCAEQYRSGMYGRRDCLDINGDPLRQVHKWAFQHENELITLANCLSADRYYEQQKER